MHEASGLDRIAKGGARDARANCLGCGGDALQLGEIGSCLNAFYVLQIAITG